MTALIALIATIASSPAQGSLKGFEIRDVNGHAHRPFALGRNVCYFFVLSDCPIANKYAPEIKRIVADYSKAGVNFFLVHVDRTLNTGDALKHAKEYGYKFPILIDRDHFLTKLSGATISPEAAVFSKEKLVYRGRIDDLYPDLGRRRPKATTLDLRNALSAVVKGRPVPTPRTKAVGCLITVD